MAKRRGRGYGSGKGGHTVGRGQKGQKTRNKIHILFQGVKTKKSTLKRLPLLRGKGKLKSSIKPVAISLDKLNIFKDGDKVNLDSLIKKGIVSVRDAKKYGVKILLGGKLIKKLEVSVPVSSSVKVAIEKSKGKVV